MNSKNTERLKKKDTSRLLGFQHGSVKTFSLKLYDSEKPILICDVAWFDRCRRARSYLVLTKSRSETLPISLGSNMVTPKYNDALSERRGYTNPLVFSYWKDSRTIFCCTEQEWVMDGCCVDELSCSFNLYCLSIDEANWIHSALLETSLVDAVLRSNIETEWSLAYPKKEAPRDVRLYRYTLRPIHLQGWTADCGKREI